MSNYCIKSINLTKIYPGGIKAVNGVSFKVDYGEIYGFLGPNGAGKTTTLGMLITVIKPTSGDAYIAGYNIHRDASKIREKIGVMFQDPTIDRDLTGWENLYVHGLAYGINRNTLIKRIDELLEFVGLSEFANTQVRRYSGGMIRRLEIARALLHKPEVLFLDEPTLGLDPQSRAKMWDVIRDLNKEGVTIFLTTHYLEEADRLCDRIAIIDYGRIVCEGKPSELKNMIGGDVIYVKISKSDSNTNEFINTLSRIGKVKLIGDQVSIVVKNAPKTLPKIFELAEEYSIRISEIRYTQPSLDDVFLYVTGRRLRDTEVSSLEFIRMRRIRRMR